jgi:hypothetical protein
MLLSVLWLATVLLMVANSVTVQSNTAVWFFNMVADNVGVNSAEKLQANVFTLVMVHDTVVVAFKAAAASAVRVK